VFGVLRPTPVIYNLYLCLFVLRLKACNTSHVRNSTANAGDLLDRFFFRPCSRIWTRGHCFICFRIRFPSLVVLWLLVAVCAFLCGLLFSEWIRLKANSGSRSLPSCLTSLSHGDISLEALYEQCVSMFFIFD